MLLENNIVLLLIYILLKKKIKTEFNEIDLLDDDIKYMQQKDLNNQIIHLTKYKERIINEFNYKYEDNNVDEMFNKILYKGTQNDKYEINKMEENIENTKKNIKFFNIKLDEINKNKKKVIENDIEYTKIEINDNCQICFNDIESNIALLQCGHLYCKNCVKEMMKSCVNKCPMCRTILKNIKIYTIKCNNVVDQNNLIMKYGTKIGNLINICRKIEGKIVLFSYSDTLIDNLFNILNNNHISTIMFDNNLEKFEENNKKVLILSSKNNASGLNITCASTIIILEPNNGTYIERKELENQLIGRLHRIGQNKEINIIKIIIKNTIDHLYDIENKIKDNMINDNSLDIYINKKSVEI